MAGQTSVKLYKSDDIEVSLYFENEFSHVIILFNSRFVMVMRLIIIISMLLSVT